jgi:hypothetical protein
MSKEEDQLLQDDTVVVALRKIIKDQGTLLDWRQGRIKELEGISQKKEERIAELEKALASSQATGRTHLRRMRAAIRDANEAREMSQMLRDALQLLVWKIRERRIDIQPMVTYWSHLHALGLEVEHKLPDRENLEQLAEKVHDSDLQFRLGEEKEEEHLCDECGRDQTWFPCAGVWDCEICRIEGRVSLLEAVLRDNIRPQLEWAKGSIPSSPSLAQSEAYCVFEGMLADIKGLIG